MNSAYGPKLPLTIDKKDGFLSISKITEEVKQNFKILLLTSPGERIFSPNFGVGIRKFLFENRESEDVDFLLEKKISEQVKTYLPSVKIVNINIYEEDMMENLLYITIQFYIEGTSFRDQLTLSFSQ